MRHIIFSSMVNLMIEQWLKWIGLLDIKQDSQEDNVHLVSSFCRNGFFFLASQKIDDPFRDERAYLLIFNYGDWSQTNN